MVPALVALAGLVGLAAIAPRSVRAQEPEVRLGITYEPGYVPGMLVLPIRASAGHEEDAATAGEILRTDLDYSDRFDMISLPDSVSLDGGAAGTALAADPPNYALWNQLGAVWLVTAEITDAPGTRSPLLRVGLHDVVYGRLENVRAFSLPPLAASDFRMSVHRASDEVVGWAVAGERGIAATRIALRRRDGEGGSHLVLIDSDGQNVQRLATGQGNVFSPAFSPDASRIAYTTQDDSGTFTLVEADLATGGRRTVASGDLLLSPAWTPDGRLTYAEAAGGQSRIVIQGAGPLVEGRGSALNPTFSPDGEWIAYEADPEGEPQIYVRRVEGGRARRISIYDRREDTRAAGPAWSPIRPRIAYAALNNSLWQIFTVNPDGTDRRMLTRRGESEDPSWAPDGRHLVFSSMDSRGSTVWILDTVTGRARILTAGQLDGLPDWSPPIPPGR